MGSTAPAAGSGGHRRGGSRHSRSLGQLGGEDLGHPGLLHGHAVQGVGLSEERVKLRLYAYEAAGSGLQGSTGTGTSLFNQTGGIGLKMNGAATSGFKMPAGLRILG